MPFSVSGETNGDYRMSFRHRDMGLKGHGIREHAGARRAGPKWAGLVEAARRKCVGQVVRAAK